MTVPNKRRTRDGVIIDHDERILTLERVQSIHTLIAVFDSDGVGLTPGIKGDVQLHRRYEILSWSLLADQTGDIVIDIWRTDYANYPPTNFSSITGGAEPEIVSDDKATSDDVSAWQVFIEPGDTLRYNIDSVNDIARVTLVLELVG